MLRVCGVRARRTRAAWLLGGALAAWFGVALAQDATTILEGDPTAGLPKLNYFIATVLVSAE